MAETPKKKGSKVLLKGMGYSELEVLLLYLIVWKLRIMRQILILRIWVFAEMGSITWF